MRLAGGQMRHEARVGALHRDGEDAADLVERGRKAVLEEAHEGANGGEPRVARAGAVGALVLEKLKEPEHERRVEVLDLEIRGRHAHARAGKREQQLEGVGVGRPGISHR